MPEQIYAIVQQHHSGLFYWLRETYRVAPHIHGVAAIFKGPIGQVSRKAEEFITRNQGKNIRLLSSQEITDLL